MKAARTSKRPWTSTPCSSEDSPSDKAHCMSGKTCGRDHLRVPRDWLPNKSLIVGSPVFQETYYLSYHHPSRLFYMPLGKQPLSPSLYLNSYVNSSCPSPRALPPFSRLRDPALSPWQACCCRHCSCPNRVEVVMSMVAATEAKLFVWKGDKHAQPPPPSFLGERVLVCCVLERKKNKTKTKEAKETKVIP